jgi:hypothetical protein
MTIETNVLPHDGCDVALWLMVAASLTTIQRGNYGNEAPLTNVVPCFSGRYCCSRPFVEGESGTQEVRANGSTDGLKDNIN